MCDLLFHNSIQELGHFNFKPTNSKGKVIKSTAKNRPKKKKFVSLDMGMKTIEFKVMRELANPNY